MFGYKRKEVTESEVKKPVVLRWAENVACIEETIMLT
jgi:hypothetical protein